MDEKFVDEMDFAKVIATLVKKEEELNRLRLENADLSNKIKMIPGGFAVECVPSYSVTGGNRDIDRKIYEYGLRKLYKESYIDWRFDLDDLKVSKGNHGELITVPTKKECFDKKLFDNYTDVFSNNELKEILEPIFSKKYDEAASKLIEDYSEPDSVNNDSDEELSDEEVVDDGED